MLYILIFLYVYKLKDLSLHSQVEKYDREHLARKLNLELSTQDMFDRQQVAGDPEVRQFDRQVIQYNYKRKQTNTCMYFSPSVADATATTTTQFPAHPRLPQWRERKTQLCKVWLWCRMKRSPNSRSHLLTRWKRGGTCSVNKFTFFCCLHFPSSLVKYWQLASRQPQSTDRYSATWHLLCDPAAVISCDPATVIVKTHPAAGYSYAIEKRT